MALTEEQRTTLRTMIVDKQWEAFHAYYDAYICGRLHELDPEFLTEIDKFLEGIPFGFEIRNSNPLQRR